MPTPPQFLVRYNGRLTRRLKFITSRRSGRHAFAFEVVRVWGNE